MVVSILKTGNHLLRELDARDVIIARLEFQSLKQAITYCESNREIARQIGVSGFNL